ncbi:MAG: hypothetical protein IJJ33_00715 [Victivallales bacterium]|nr:hypothetical protein [Victivallales bacterium]
MTPQARQMDFFDRHVTHAIMEKYGLDDLAAIRSFLQSETYQMLLDRETLLYTFSPLVIFELWEAEKVTGDPRNSVYIREEC